MLMITPLFCSRMIGITCLAARMQLLRLIATQRSNASSVILSSSASPPASDTPTLLCRMSMRPQRACVSAAIALRSAFLVTSALKATAVPWLAPIMSTVSCADLRSRSTQTTLAPSRAKVRAVARPLPTPSPGLCPAPTTMATLSCRRMFFLPFPSSRPERAARSGGTHLEVGTKRGPSASLRATALRQRILLQHFLVLRLVVDLDGRQHPHHGAVEGDGEDQVGHVLVAEVLLDLGEGLVGHADVAHHLARALEHQLGEGIELAGLAFGLEEQALDVLVGDAEFLADLHVVREFVLRLLHPAHLQDGELPQARIERALVADVAADPVESLGHAGRIDQQPRQVDRPLQQVALLGRQLVGIDIGQAGHSSSSYWAWLSRSGPCNVTPPSTTSTWPVM